MSSSFYAMRNKQTHKRKISFLDSVTYDLSLDNCFTLFFFLFNVQTEEFLFLHSLISLHLPLPETP